MTEAAEPQHINDRAPNWYGEGEYEGSFYLQRCFSCEPTYGTENWAPAVATGRCCWCGWSVPTTEQEADKCES